jgi:hypothetical protein
LLWTTDFQRVGGGSIHSSYPCRLFALVEAAMGEWEPFRRLPDLSSAQVLVELLLNRGVPACLDAPDPLPGLDRDYLVSVPPHLVHRARWVAPESPFDEVELAYLVTDRLRTE